MVNDNFGHGRVRVGARSSVPAPEVVPNPDAAALEVGIEVVPHYADPLARDNHVPGVILELDGGRVLVRWAPGDVTEWLPASDLVKR